MVFIANPLPQRVITVAASNASSRARANAAYRCTGTADEVKINQALAATGEGGEVKLDAGNFVLAGSIATTADKQVIRGQGTITESANLTPMLNLAHAGCSVSELTFVGSETTNSGITNAAIAINASKCTVQDCSIAGKNVGIDADGDESRIVGNDLTGVGQANTNSTSSCVTIAGNRHIVNSNQMRGYAQAVLAGARTENTVIDGNRIEEMGDNAIYLSSAVNCVVSDNAVHGCRDLSSAIKVRGFSNIIDGNTVEDIANTGVSGGGIEVTPFDTALTVNDVSDTAQDGAAGTITLAAGSSSTDDVYNGWQITLTGVGTGAGQVRELTDYDGTTKVATVSTNWSTPPDATSTYTLSTSKTWDYTNKLIAFSSGSEEPRNGDALTGATSAVNVTCGKVWVLDGAWADGDAEGYLLLQTDGSSLTLGENINNASSTTNNVLTYENSQPVTRVAAYANIVSNNTLQNMSSWGIRIGGINSGDDDDDGTDDRSNYQHGTVIIGNTLIDVANSEVQDLGAIGVVSAFDCLVVANTISNVRQDNLGAIVVSYAPGTVVRGNKVTACETDGIWLQHSPDVVIDDNDIHTWNAAGTCVQANTAATGFMDNLVIRRNHFYGDIELDQFGVEIRDNIMFGRVNLTSDKIEPSDRCVISGNTLRPGRNNIGIVMTFGGRGQTMGELDISRNTILADTTAVQLVAASPVLEDDPPTNKIDTNVTPDIIQRFAFNDNYIDTSITVCAVRILQSAITWSDTAQSGGASTIELAAADSQDDDEYNGYQIEITGNTGVGQLRTISDYVNATNIATVSEAWSTQPDNTSIYEIRQALDIKTAEVRGGRIKNDRGSIEAVVNQAGTLTINGLRAEQTAEFDTFEITGFENVDVIGCEFGTPDVTNGAPDINCKGVLTVERTTLRKLNNWGIRPGEEVTKIFWINNRALDGTVTPVTNATGSIPLVFGVYSSGTTGGAASAGAGNQYVELDIDGTVYRLLHDGTV